jgi:hypothetical protein
MKVSGKLLAPVALSPGKISLYTLVRRLDGPQSRSGRCGEAKNLFPLPDINPDSSVIKPVARFYTD